MLKNKKNLKYFGLILVLFLCSCGGKKKVKTEEVYIPTNSDYIIAVNNVYLESCKLAQNFVLEYLDTAKLNFYDSDTSDGFNTVRSYIYSMGDAYSINYIRENITQICQLNTPNLAAKSAKFLQIDDQFDPKYYLEKGLIVNRFLAPNRKVLQMEFKEDCDKMFTTSSANSIYKSKRYIASKNKKNPIKANFSLDKVTNQIISMYVDLAVFYEDSAKANYVNWESEQGKLAMKYLKDQK